MAAAASVPSKIAIEVEIAATLTDRLMASQISFRLQATANHLAVRPGGGNW